MVGPWRRRRGVSDDHSEIFYGSALFLLCWLELRGLIYDRMKSRLRYRLWVQENQKINMQRIESDLYEDTMVEQEKREDARD